MADKSKKQYGIYKTENRVYTNKISKLVRHCKAFPKDEVARENLERIKNKGYNPRTKPLNPGSNPTMPKVKHTFVRSGSTAGEQLSELLGIPMPKYRRRKKVKTSVTVKKRKDVKHT